jgi:hypothetical protein
MIKKFLTARLSASLPPASLEYPCTPAHPNNLRSEEPEAIPYLEPVGGRPRVIEEGAKGT